ncbi:sugar O-acetyltransferase [Conexibacter sp. SYSU D00693]|uniref:sugar O-acetyltransferase n=1 Tax=Conexibacter sp. SYSU D00693 TaxID=2812560 RepID=UPI00196AFCD6|nr:sugar O-acetyltransferase [Conexibacter sp. SYSU D00693]
MGEMLDRMLRGELYLADDPEIESWWDAVATKVEAYNAPGLAQAERDVLLRDLLAEVGVGVVVRPRFLVEYGQVRIGDGTFINFDCVMLDVAPVTIGARCWIATRVQFLTATHPIDLGPRSAGWEYAKPIALGDDVWLGGGVIVCPGVTIGAGSVIGAGAVVTKDVPAGVVAAGNPARVLREIGDADRVDVPEL